MAYSIYGIHAQIHYPASLRARPTISYNNLFINGPGHIGESGAIPVTAYQFGINSNGRAFIVAETEEALEIGGCYYISSREGYPDAYLEFDAEIY